MVVVAMLAMPTAGTAALAAPDPLLDDQGKGPCDPRPDQPDYVPGVDVGGNSVVQANLPAAKNPVPDGVLMPLRNGAGRSGRGPSIALNGKTLDPILNPPPACPPQARPSR